MPAASQNQIDGVGASLSFGSLCKSTRAFSNKCLAIAAAGVSGLLISLAIGCAGRATSATPSVKVSEVTLFGDLDCFRIETPTATYLYGTPVAAYVRQERGQQAN